MRVEGYEFLGDESGQLLADDNLKRKIDEAAERFGRITDPGSAHQAVKGLSYSDIITILECRDISHDNVFRILGVNPLWAVRPEGRIIVEKSTRALMKQFSLGTPIPDDIEMMVKGWASHS